MRRLLLPRRVDVVQLDQGHASSMNNHAGPLVLPWSEKLMFATNFIARTLGGKHKYAPYVPDFTQAFDHFCLHAGTEENYSGSKFACYY